MGKEYTTDDLSYIAYIVQEQLYKYYMPWYKELAVNYTLNMFQKRVGKIKYASNYDLFKSTKSMQLKIEAYNLDSEKFWLLLLFLYDYTESCFGEYPVFSHMSIADSLGMMRSILKSGNCKLIISNQTKSAEINAKYIKYIKKDLVKLLEDLPQKTDCHRFPFIEKKRNDVLWHKIKFYMEMLDYFLTNYQPVETQNKKKRKDWLFYSQALYLVGYLKEEKYLTGHVTIEKKIVNLDGANSVKIMKSPLTGLGKFFTDNTKNINDTAIRGKSRYNYKP